MKINNVNTLFEQTINNEKITDKQKNVLKSSLKLFAKKGYENTSTSDIASLAHVSEGTVYKHFKTKENILNTILIPFINGVVPQVANEFSDSINQNHFNSLKSFLAYVIQNRLNYVIQNRFVIKVFIQELLKKPQLLHKSVNNLKKIIENNFGKSFQKLKNNGQLVDWPTSRIFQYILSTLIGYVYPIVINDDYDVNIDQIINECIEFLVKGLRP